MIVYASLDVGGTEAGQRPEHGAANSGNMPRTIKPPGLTKRTRALCAHRDATAFHAQRSGSTPDGSYHRDHRSQPTKTKSSTHPPPSPAYEEYCSTKDKIGRMKSADDSIA